MFDNLSDKLNAVFKKLKGHGKLTEKNIEEGLREVRMALLEADVHFKVVKSFISSIKERCARPGGHVKPDSRSAGHKNSQ